MRIWAEPLRILLSSVELEFVTTDRPLDVSWARGRIAVLQAAEGVSIAVLPAESVGPGGMRM